MEMSHSSHTRRLEAIAFDAVASTRTRGVTTFAMSAAMATAPRALDALLVNAKNSASPELVATTFLSCRRCKEMPAKHHTRRRSRPSGLRTLSEKTSTIGCSACLLYTTKHLGLPFRNRTRRLRAGTFLVFGSCIRLASSFTANCTSHLSRLR